MEDKMNLNPSPATLLLPTTVGHLRVAGEIITLFRGVLFFTSVSAWPSPPFPPPLLPSPLPLPLSLSLSSL